MTAPPDCIDEGRAATHGLVLGATGSRGALHVGQVDAALDGVWLDKARITHILAASMTFGPGKAMAYEVPRPAIERHILNAFYADAGSLVERKTVQGVKDGLHFIRDSLVGHANRGILVHCAQGVSRSVTMVMAYLLIFEVPMSIQEGRNKDTHGLAETVYGYAKGMVTQNRPQARPKPEFEHDLKILGLVRVPGDIDASIDALIARKKDEHGQRFRLAPNMPATSLIAQASETMPYTQALSASAVTGFARHGKSEDGISRQDVSANQGAAVDVKVNRGEEVVAVEIPSNAAMYSLSQLQYFTETRTSPCSGAVGSEDPDFNKHREEYLSEQEFQSLFGIAKSQSANLATWKKVQLKKAHGIF